MAHQVEQRVRAMQQEAYIRLLRVVCAQPYDWVRDVPVSLHAGTRLSMSPARCAGDRGAAYQHQEIAEDN